jgi:beta-phosphoglucomutase
VSQTPAFLFDMDGVLVDSSALHRRAWEIYCGRFGIEVTAAMHGRMYGKHNSEVVPVYFGEGLSPQTVSEHGAAKEKVYRELLAKEFESALVPGIREFLARYAAVPKAVASNAEPANIALLLDLARLGSYFPVVVDGDQVANPKPHPDVFLRAAALLGKSPEECIVFEDSVAGVTAAQAAGMRVVGILTTHAELSGTSCSIPDFQSRELPSWLSTQGVR